MRTAFMLFTTVLLGSVALAQSDFGVLAIVSPPDTVLLDTEVVPQVRIYADSDNDDDAVQVYLRIDTLYDDMLDTIIEPGETLTLDLTEWTADTEGVFTVLCSLYADDDTLFDNDTLSQPVVVRALRANFAVEAIPSPPGTFRFGPDTIPLLVVIRAAEANEDDSVTVRLQIDSTLYDETLDVYIDPGATDTIDEFSEWEPDSQGVFLVHCELLVEDDTAANDTLSKEVHVLPPWLDMAVASIEVPEETIPYGEALAPIRDCRRVGQQQRVA